MVEFVERSNGGGSRERSGLAAHCAVMVRS